MNTVPYYECGFCGKRYEIMSDCQACETGHIGGDISTGTLVPTCTIDSLAYLPLSKRRSGLPSHVTLKFPDGQTHRYITEEMRTYEANPVM